MEKLLSQVNEIVKEDAILRENQRSRGQLFNVFEILNLETNETRTHSAFLAALLDPNGNHGAGDRFLKTFITHCLGGWDDFDTADARVYIEYYIGPKTKTTGGRIDILIESQSCGKAIIIENKIYAGDQECQLLRYWRFGNSQYGRNNYKLIYLTLFGNEASDYSVKDGRNELKVEEDYIAIGYDSEITKWLDNAQPDSSTVQETIVQYANLIKKLTNQNKNMTNKIALTILSNPEFVHSAIAIEKSLTTIKAELQKRFWDKLFDKLQPIAKATSSPVKFYYCDTHIDSLSDLIEKHTETKAYGKNKCYGIEIEVAKWDGYTVLWTIEVENNIFYGVRLRDKRGDIIKNGERIFYPIKEFIKNNGRNWSSSIDSTYLCWDYPNGNRINFINLDNPEIYALADPTVESEMINRIAEDSRKYIEELRQLCK